MNTQGISFLLQIPAGAPAQNAQAAEEISGGQVFAGLLVLLAMLGSLVMLSIWLTRYLSTGNALPAANRGILRVPPLLTFITAGLSGFFALMVLISGVNEPQAAPVPATPAAPGAAPTPGAVNPQAQPPVQDPSSDSPDAPVATPIPDSSNRIPNVEERLADPTGENAENVRKAKERAEAVQSMYDGVMNTIVLDTILLLAVGAVVWYVGKQGRVRLDIEDTLSASNETQRFETPMRWNDLDSVAPPSFPPSEPYTGFGYGPPKAQAPPDSQFSMLEELRFAGETFLAAYLPTTILRLVIIKLIESVTGEMPGQHPFLEMLDEGVSPGLMGLIFVIAVVVAPVVEELQFRVVILGGIAQLGIPVRALLLSSVLFAFAHGFPDCFALLPLAFVLGYAYLRRRSYITVMMVHFLFNLFNMALALMAML